MSIDLVTGGSGFIGAHLVAALLARGREVRVLDLVPPQTQAAGMVFVRGSLLDPACLSQAMAGVCHVYHLAGIASLWTPDRARFEQVNAEGTERVAQAALVHRAARFVHCSTEAILLPARRPDGSALITESREPVLADMPGPYTRSKLLAEHAVRAAVAAGLDAVIVNPTVPIGPGDRNLTPPAAMLAMFLNGQSPAFLDCVLNLVDVRDVAAGMLAAAACGRCGERYILGGDNVALRDLLALLALRSGRTMPKRAIPGSLALMAATIAEAIAAWTGRAPAATREGVRLALRSAPFDSAKARHELGYAPRSFDVALSDALAWLEATRVWRREPAATIRR